MLGIGLFLYRYSNYAVIVMVIAMITASLLVMPVVANTNYNSVNIPTRDLILYKPLVSLNNKSVYIFNVAPANKEYANKILSLAGLPPQTGWSQYRSIYNDIVLSALIRMDGYSGRFMVTDRGHVYYKLVNHKQFPPLYNSTDRDEKLIQELLYNVISITDNVTIEYKGLSGSIIKIKWGYNVHFNPQTGKWESEKIPTDKEIDNPWNTYSVKIGGFTWPYKISIRWGIVNNKVVLACLKGFFPNVIGGHNFIIDKQLLMKILTAYNSAIARVNETFRNVTGVYVNSTDDLAILRSYYDVFIVNGSYYLVPTLDIIPRTFVKKLFTGFYVVIHIFPDKVYGETETLAGGASDSPISREVPRSLFTEKPGSYNQIISYNNVVIISALIVSTIIVGIILFKKLKK